MPELTAPIVFPAKIDENGKQIAPKEEYIGINYQGFTAIIVDALQQQQAVIENQQKQIDELKALVQAQAGLNNSSDATSNRQAVELSNQTAVVLNQNTPNPFAEQTVISYNIPQDANQAQILFYDQNGRLIQTSTISTKGVGYLTVFASDLSSSTHNYTLVIDGKIIDTKKMIKQ